MWGDEEHVRKLFDEQVTGLEMRRQHVVMDDSANPTGFREYWKHNYGPTIAVYRFNEDRERLADLDRDFLSFLASCAPPWWGEIDPTLRFCTRFRKCRGQNRSVAGSHFRTSAESLSHCWRAAVASALN